MPRRRPPERRIRASRVFHVLAVSGREFGMAAFAVLGHPVYRVPDDNDLRESDDELGDGKREGDIDEERCVMDEGEMGDGNCRLGIDGGKGVKVGRAHVVHRRHPVE